MTCVRVQMGKTVALVSVGGPTHRLIDYRGKVWHFEEHHYFGPTVTRKDGSVCKSQPGERSPFWAAYKMFIEARKPGREEGVTP